MELRESAYKLTIWRPGNALCRSNVTLPGMGNMTAYIERQLRLTQLFLWSQANLYPPLFPGAFSPLHSTIQIMGCTSKTFNSSQSLLQWQHTAAYVHPKICPQHVSPTAGLNHVVVIVRAYVAQYQQRWSFLEKAILHKETFLPQNSSIWITKGGCNSLYLNTRCCRLFRFLCLFWSSIFGQASSLEATSLIRFKKVKGSKRWAPKATAPWMCLM